VDPPRPGLAGAALGRSGTAGTAQALLPPFRGREGRGRDGLPCQREGVGVPLGSGGRSRHGIVPPRGECFFVLPFFGGRGVVALLAFVGFSSGWFGWSLGLLGRVESPPCLFLCVCFRVVPLFQPNLTSLPFPSLPPSDPRPYAALPPGQSRPGPQDAAPRDRPRRPAGSHHRGGRDSRAPPPAPLVVVALLGGLLGRRGGRGCCRRRWCRRRQEADRSGWVGRIGHHLLRQARQGGRSPGVRLRRRRRLLLAPPPPAGMVAVPSYPHHPIFRGGTYVGGTAPGPGPGPVPPPFPQGRGRVSLRGRGGPASHASSSADGGGGGRGILPTDRRDETDSSRSRDPYRSRTVSARGRGRGGNRAAPRPGSYAGGGIPAGLSTLVAANLPAPKPAAGAVAAAAASSISGGSGARAARQAPEGAPAAPLRQ
jgi:hypothetical protein